MLIFNQLAKQNNFNLAGSELFKYRTNIPLST